MYASDRFKAAAMLETIALHEPLKAKNEFFAWLVVMRAKHEGARVQEIAAQLRAWSTG
ncbi:hypothetical protein [Streptomyces sp. NPDC006335]|uniref:hypothetical protein n=1 Tax=Streptomyces sp. NPDC006335 TaxID=3156895 RepID=UPI0033ABF5F9